MTSSPQVGEEFGRFRITRVLGRGGMGVVYAATDGTLGREVALKVLNPDLSLDEEFHDRFSAEAAILAQVDSVHIVQVYEHGRIGDCLYLATQLIRGGDLAARLSADGPLPIDDALAVTSQLCRALEDAHDAGIIHRDVKPGNVLLRAGTQLHAYLCDFGIAVDRDASHTTSGQVAGSLGYMAPERHNGARGDERSDLYSVGCLLYAVLSGRPPYSGTDVQVALGHLHHEIPQLPDPSPATRQINRILSRALAKNPDDRYRTVAELREALYAVQHDPGPSPSDTIIRPPSPAPVLADTQHRAPPSRRPAPHIGPPAHAAVAPPPYRPPQPPPPSREPATQEVRRRRTRLALLIGLTAVAGLVLGAGTIWELADEPTGDETTAVDRTKQPTPQTPAPGSEETTQRRQHVKAPPRPSETDDEPALSATDPLGVGYEEQNLNCSTGFIVVLTSEEAATPATTVSTALARFPDAPDKHYLDPAKSCSNLTGLTDKVNLTRFPYLGPFPDAIAACEARMAWTDTTTYVIEVAPHATTATYCSCFYDDADLPALDNVSDAEPTGDNRYWTMELQYMLYDAGLNPRRLVPGKFGELTTEMVRSLQSESGLPRTGAMNPDSWAALKVRAC